jgi:hypothetical protein
MMPALNPAVGLVMDPWRFDPAAAIVSANRVIRAGPDAPRLLRQWVSQAPGIEEAMAAVIATCIAVAPVPVHGRPSNFRSDAPPLAHHPFVLCGDVPFLPADALSAGGAMMAPADYIEACFRHGALLKSPLIPEDPFHAATALLSSKEWVALIVPEMNTPASRMVRLQAARAKGRAPDFEPSTAKDDQFEEWWEDCIQQ